MFWIVLQSVTAFSNILISLKRQVSEASKITAEEKRKLQQFLHVLNML